MTMTSDSRPVARAINMRQVFKTWWPLAASWLLMGLEGPALSAVMARMADPEINLAAYGGVVFPLALIIESPVIMLLAASTALSKDWNAYRRIRQYMLISGAVLTALHVIIAFTPVYYWLVEQIIGVPAEIVEPARLGLMIMTPWTWSIGYRRFQQGVLIRYGRSSAVGAGTVVRLLTDGFVLIIGYLTDLFPGIVVATGAQAAGVISEALYSGLRVRPVIRERIKKRAPGEGLSWRDFGKFYFPLALTSLLSLLWQPIGSAALSRLPLALSSLAIWPIVSGLTFMLRSLGFAYNEVVVALLGIHGSSGKLRRFTLILTLGVAGLHILVAATPLSRIWFEKITALQPGLADLAYTAFWLALPLPVMSVLISWFQGAIMYSGKTRAIPESILIFFLAVLIQLGIGVALLEFPGIFIGMTAFSLATIVQTIWLYVRSRAVMRDVANRDAAPPDPALPPEFN